MTLLQRVEEASFAKNAHSHSHAHADSSRRRAPPVSAVERMQGEEPSYLSAVQESSLPCVLRAMRSLSGVHDLAGSEI